jgi:hypothetical protein
LGLRRKPADLRRATAKETEWVREVGDEEMKEASSRYCTVWESKAAGERGGSGER